MTREERIRSSVLILPNYFYNKFHYHLLQRCFKHLYVSDDGIYVYETKEEDCIDYCRANEECSSLPTKNWFCIVKLNNDWALAIYKDDSFNHKCGQIVPRKWFNET